MLRSQRDSSLAVRYGMEFDRGSWERRGRAAVRGVQVRGQLVTQPLCSYAVVVAEYGYWFAGVRIPDLRGPVGTSSREAAPVRIERDSVHPVAATLAASPKFQTCPTTMKMATAARETQPSISCLRLRQFPLGQHTPCDHVDTHCVDDCRLSAGPRRPNGCADFKRFQAMRWGTNG
jgi:hypothetical protein